MLDYFGGALIIVSIDGRSKMGRFIKSFIESPFSGFRVSRSSYYKGFVFSIDRDKNIRSRA